MWQILDFVLYLFLWTVCQGASGDVAVAKKSFAEVPSLVRTKNNQIEAFVLKRVGSDIMYYEWNTGVFVNISNYNQLT